MKSAMIDQINLPWKERIRKNHAAAGSPRIRFEGTVHFFTPTLFFKDAVSRCLLEEASLLSLMCDSVKIYAENPIGELAAFTGSFEDFLNGVNLKEDILIYQYSIGTETLNKVVQLSMKKHAIYHGITPPSLFGNTSPIVSALCQKGIDEFPLLNHFDSWMTNSEFLMRELEATESRPHPKSILPPFVTLDKWDDVQEFSEIPTFVNNPAVSEGKRILYVGRRTSTKNIMELVRILKELNELDRYHLVIAGGGADPEYHMQVWQLAVELQTNQRVCFVDEPSDSQLKYLYRSASALVTTSLHEGFCVPIAEAMQMNIPAFAANYSAMPMTLGQSSKPISLGAPKDAAKQIHEILSSPDRLNLYLSGQRKEYELRYCDRAATNGYIEYFKQVVLETSA